MQNAAVLPATHAAEAKEAPVSGSYPLMAASERSPVEICSLRGNDDIKKHLAGLGFVPGAQISVVCHQGGNLIADVKGSRIALDRQMACRIMVCDS